MARLTGFAHLNAEKASLYRAILESFTEAKGRFVLHLRKSEVLEAITDHQKNLGAPAERPAPEEIDAALQQLCAWRNLEAHPDTTEVATVEEFYRPRFLYQLTPEGDAVEKALGVFKELVEQPGELQTRALTDIRVLLGELEALAREQNPDDGKVARAMRALGDRFNELTLRAQRFMSGLQRTIDLQGIDIETFLHYKQNLIDYLERFVSELVVATVEIVALTGRIETAGVDRLLKLVSERQVADALLQTDQARAESITAWRATWRGLRSWFTDEESGMSQAEILRARTRAAIPALLNAIASIHDRRVTRSDRPTDLCTLARWFAETDTNAEAHRLWRAAFGLTPSRHLTTNAETLALQEDLSTSPRSSWLDAVPLQIAPRLRRTGRYERRGRKTAILDRSKEKAWLARLGREEADQLRHARRRLARGRRMRLSEIGTLDTAAFSLFLDLLGEVLASRIDPRETTSATSTDGALRITLEPTLDDAEATIETTFGRLRGLDCFVLIEPVFANDDVFPDSEDRDDISVGDGPASSPSTAVAAPASTAARRTETAGATATYGKRSRNGGPDASGQSAVERSAG